jgi:Mn-containing catalase
MSSGNALRGPWNQGESTQLGETFQYIEDPIKHVLQTNGLLDQTVEGTDRTEEQVQQLNTELGKTKKEFVNMSAPMGPQQWNEPLIQADIEENGDGVMLEKD